MNDMSTLSKTILVAAIYSQLVWHSQAFAVSGVTITGELTAKMPEVILAPLTGVTANVQSVNIKPSQGGNAGCNLTTDDIAAKAFTQTQGNLLCLLEWSLPSGLSAYSDGFQGYFNNYGNNIIGYTVSIYSGSNKEKVVVETGSMTIHAAQAIAPNLIELISDLTTGPQVGKDIESNSKGNILKSVKVTADSRPYNQVVNIPSVGACTIPKDTQSCTISTAGITIITDPSNDMGSNSYSFSIDSDNAYFATMSNEFKSQYNIAWDFRAPNFDYYVMQSVAAGNELPITKTLDNGMVITVVNEKALLTVKTPHEGKSGTWWHPNAKLTLKPDASYQIKTPTYVLGGDNILSNDVINLPTGEFQLNPKLSTQYGDTWAFEFDLSTLPDGVYIPQAKLIDAYSNYWEGSVSTSTSIDRNPPTIRIYNTNGGIVNAADPIYFFDDILVAAVDSMSGGGKVIAASVDGQSVLGEGVEEGVEYLKMLKTPESQLEPNSNKILSVVVKDNAGNTSVEEISIRYMPVKWQIDDRSQTYQRGVQSVAMPLKNTEGVGCRIYASPELARGAIGDITYRCFIEWLQYPSGLSSQWLNSQQVLTGTFQQSTKPTLLNEAQYKVWMINKKGSEAISYIGKQGFNVVEPTPPTVSVAKYREYKPEIFTTTVDGGVVTTSSAEFINGDLVFSISSSDGTQTNYPYVQSGSAQSKKRIGKVLTVGKSALWTARDIELKAQYTGDNSAFGVKNLKVLTVPSSFIIAKLETPEVVQNTQSVITAKVSIGIVDYQTRKITYDKDTMGEWSAVVAIETRSKDGLYHYKNLTDTLEIDKEGKASANIPFVDLAIGSSRLVALVKVDSKLPDYEKTIKSNSAFFQIYKGEAIDGEIQLRRMAGKAPFTAQLLYMPDTLNDRRAKGDVTWEMSKDEGVTWSVLATNKDVFQTVLANKGLYQFRAQITNKFSGIKATTDYQEILVYETPVLKINGVSALHPAEIANYTLIDNGEAVDLTSTEVQWSLDGVNWVDGSDIFTLTMDGNTRYNLQARAAYEGTELAGNARYAKAVKIVRAARLQPVRLSLPIMKAMEEGVSYTVDAVSSLADVAAGTDIITEWKLPDGTKVLAQSITYIPTGDDVTKKQVTLEVRAWADGYKTETETLKRLSPAAWRYSFPTFEIISKTSSSYAPTSGSMLISTPTDLPPYYSGVTFNVEWDVPSSYEVIRKTDKQVVFNVTEAGTDSVKATITDSRGSAKVISTYIGTNKAPEPQLSIEPRYSNNLMREPLTIIANLSGKMGHPLDRVNTVAWYLDDNLIEPKNLRVVISGVGEGVHKLKAVMTSTFNIQREYVMEVPVAKNVPPVCEVKQSNYSNVIRLDMNCSDEDGKMVKFEWNINGEISPYIGSYMYVSKTAGYNAVIIARGVDDSGAFSNSIEKSFSY
jgi:hypothetical protein